MAGNTAMKQPHHRYLVMVEPVRIVNPRVGASTEKQLFDFMVKEDRVYHDVRFQLRKGYRFLPDDDPRLRRLWLFESDCRRFASELQAVFKEDQLDQFLFKSALGNFYDLEHRVGQRVEMDMIPKGTLFSTERVLGGLGRVFIKKS